MSKETTERADAAPARSAKKRKSLPGRIMDGVASFGLTCIILIFLMVLTWRGTYAQEHLGLVAAQQKYFDSLYWTAYVRSIAVPMPGAFLLLVLLAVNLICGGILRMRRTGATLGILITHFGMLFLLAAGLVSYRYSDRGYVQFYPGEVEDTYTSFHLAEIVLSEPQGDGVVREHLISDDGFSSLRPGDQATISDPSLPFELIIDRYYANCRPQRNADGEIRFEARPHDERAPMNVSGVLVTLKVSGQEDQHGVLWEGERHPWTVDVHGTPWTVGLRRRVYDLPWAVRLEKFTKEEHPGVSTPRVFSSDVTRLDGDVEQGFHIAMNEPMRYEGYMLSQNNWGPQHRPEGRLWSMLEVSRNPSDQWPKYACYVIALGLFLHMLRKLRLHMKRQSKARTA